MTEKQAKDFFCAALDGFPYRDGKYSLELQLRTRLNTICPLIDWVKVGMELYYSAEFDVISLLKSYDMKVFLDLKLKDIPETVYNASRALAMKPGIAMFNVHADGGIAMMLAAKNGAIEASEITGIDRPKIIAVTVLTSMEAKKDDVIRLAHDTVKAGLDGIVCSALDLEYLKPELPDDFIFVTPGIRMVDGKAGDQKRIATPDFAYKAGSTLQVIGRPIYQDLDANGQLLAVRKISDLIQSVM